MWAVFVLDGDHTLTVLNSHPHQAQSGRLAPNPVPEPCNCPLVMIN